MVVICNRKLWLLPNINIKCLAIRCLLHWSWFYSLCKILLLSFSYLHYPSFLSTCGKSKLNFDDDDDGLMYRHYSLCYLQTGPFVLSSTNFFAYLILAFSQKGICFNVATALVDCWKYFRYTSRNLFLQNIESYLPLIICQMYSMCNCRQWMAMNSFPHMTIDYWKTNLFTQTKVHVLSWYLIKSTWNQGLNVMSYKMVLMIFPKSLLLILFYIFF